MEGFNDIVSSILSDPKSVEALKEIALEISKENTSKAAAPKADAEPQNALGGDMLSLLSNIDPAFLETAFSLFSGYNSVDTEKLNLLNSLKPYLSKEKQGRIDGAVRMLRILKVGRALGISPERLFGRREP